MARYLVKKQHTANINRYTTYEAEIEVADDEDVEDAMRGLGRTAWKETDQWDEFDYGEGDTYEVLERLDSPDDQPHGKPEDFGVAQVALF